MSKQRGSAPGQLSATDLPRIARGSTVMTVTAAVSVILIHQLDRFVNVVGDDVDPMVELAVWTLVSMSLYTLANTVYKWLTNTRHEVIEGEEK